VQLVGTPYALARSRNSSLDLAGTNHELRRSAIVCRVARDSAGVEFVCFAVEAVSSGQRRVRRAEVDVDPSRLFPLSGLEMGGWADQHTLDV
jgi:hypothetical protein